MVYCKNCGVDNKQKKSLHPWIAVLLGILLTGFIYSLPKNVINKKNRELSGDGRNSGNSNSKSENSEKANVELALTYMNGTNPMQGILLLKEVISKNPDNEEAGYYLGAFSMQSGQFDKAVERFRKVVELNPNNQTAKLYLGISYYKLNEKLKAKDLFLELRNTSKDTSIISSVELYLKEINN